LRFAIAAAAVGLTALTASSTFAAAFFDDFNDGNDVGWTRYHPRSTFGITPTFAFPNGGYRIAAPSSTNTTTQGYPLVGSLVAGETYQTFDVTVDLVDWNNSLDQGIGIVARAREVGFRTTDAYALTYFPADPRGLAINRYDNESAENNFPVVFNGISLDPARDYRLRFTGVGRNLTGRVYALPFTGTPLLSISTTDNTSGAILDGQVGVWGGSTASSLNTALDATLDNFNVVPEPASLAVLAGVSMLALRRRA
jgi:hypothetical protein